MGTVARTIKVRASALVGVGALAAATVGLAVLPARAAAPTLASTPYGNLAEALQKSIYFYDAEKSGPARSLGRQPLEWRGDSEPEDAAVPLVTGKGVSDAVVESGTNLKPAFIEKYRSVLDPDGNGTLDLSRGMHDAGDHVKFGLPQTYAAATLAWGVQEFRDAYVKTGTYEHILDELYWFNDYFLKATFRDANGDVIAFAYQVGNGSIDHTEWTPPEMLHHPRGAMFATADTPGSDQCADAAAAMVAMYQVVKDSDPTYAARLLDTAKALYRFARAHRGLGESGGYYGSADDNDEMTWAAAWLFEATGDASYINDIVAKNDKGVYTGYLFKIINDPQSTWQNIWVHSWDAVWGGAFAKLAPITKSVVSEQQYKDFWHYFRWNAEYWTAGSVAHVGSLGKDAYLAASPAGYSMLNGWGSARYNTAAQLCALIYRNHSAEDPDGSAQHGVDLSKWALSQMNYLMGDNPLHRSYIVGFTAKSTDTSVQHPHHRAAHGSMTNSMADPPTHRHTLWGALAGGPGIADEHRDQTNDFVYNEVTIDYNAGFVGALAGLWQYFGADQPVVKWTPPAETFGTLYWTEGKVEQENKQRTQVSIRIHDELFTPPQRVSDLSARYYFDISELVAAGQSASDVKVEIYYDEAKSLGEKPVEVSTPVHVSGNVYYVEASWVGGFYGKRDLQIGIIAAQDTSTYTDHWDPTNDYSREGLSTTAITSTQRLPVYRAGKKVYGLEPGETTPPTELAPQTPSPAPSPPMYPATPSPSSSRR